MFKAIIAFLLCVVCSYADGQSRCIVYQYPAGCPKEKKVVLRQTKNDLGYTIREEIKGFNKFLDNSSTMYCEREDGVYEYYYDDTQHYKTVVTKYDDVTGMPVDSDKVFYHYDTLSGRLNREVTVRHLNKRLPGRRPGGFRNGCDIVYGMNGLVSMRVCDEWEEFFSHDSLGRIECDSVVFPDDKFSVVKRYAYDSVGYQIFEWASDKRCPVLRQVVLGGNLRILSETVFTCKDEARSLIMFSRPTKETFPIWSKGRLKEEERTEYSYDQSGRLTETRYFFDGRHTTTNEYRYESIGGGGPKGRK